MFCIFIIIIIFFRQSGSDFEQKTSANFLKTNLNEIIERYISEMLKFDAKMDSNAYKRLLFFVLALKLRHRIFTGNFFEKIRNRNNA